MKTDELIAALSVRAGRPRGPGMAAVLGWALAGSAIYTLALISLIAGVRPDLLEKVDWVLAKAGLSVAFGVVALPLVLRAARPGAQSGVWAVAAVAVFLLAAAVACVAIVQAGSAELAIWTSDVGFPHILVVVPLMAVPVASTLFVWMRKQAPTHAMLAGCGTGLLAGSVVAAGYALTCPVDTTAFVAAAYSLAIAVCGAGGALAGRYLLRW